MFDEFIHLFKLSAEQQVGDLRAYQVGHIASYDLEKNAVRVLFPSIQNENGVPAVSPWIQLGSPWVGKDSGFQIHPIGGSTFEEPTKGEQVLVCMVEREAGLSFVATMLYTELHTPPASLLEEQFKPGEAVWMHRTGSFLRFQDNGDIALETNQDTIVNSSRDVLIQGGRNIQLNCLTQLQVNNAPSISINSGNSNLDVELITDGVVNINADDQQVNVFADKAQVITDTLTTLLSKEIDIRATNAIRIDAPVVEMKGQNISIGNPDPVTNTTHKIKLDATLLESIGRFSHKSMGKRIAIGATANYDPVRAHRIDIRADGAGGSLASKGGGKVSKNIIAVNAPGAGSEFYVHAHTQSYGGTFLGLGKPERNSIAEQEGVREAYGVTISATKYIDQISNMNLTLNAKNGLLFAQGKTAASIYSPQSVNIQAGNIDDPMGEVTVSGYNKATLASNEKVIVQGSNDEPDSVAIIGGGGIDIDCMGTFDVNSHAVFMVATTSDINFRTVGIINAGATGGPFSKLVTEDHLSKYNTHIHVDSMGGDTTPPTVTDSNSHTELLRGT